MVVGVTDLRGAGSFNSIFHRRSFLNLVVNFFSENWSTFAEVIVKVKMAHFFAACLMPAPVARLP